MASCSNCYRLLDDCESPMCNSCVDAELTTLRAERDELREEVKRLLGMDSKGRWDSIKAWVDGEDESLRAAESAALEELAEVKGLLGECLLAVNVWPGSPSITVTERLDLARRVRAVVGEEKSDE